MATDNVNHPSHYNSGKIEVIEAIEDWKVGFHLGNAIKYIARAGKKDMAKTVEDLEKAIWYVRRYVEVTFKDNPRKPNDMPQRREVENEPCKICLDRHFFDPCPNPNSLAHKHGPCR